MVPPLAKLRILPINYRLSSCLFPVAGLHGNSVTPGNNVLWESVLIKTRLQQDWRSSTWPVDSPPQTRKPPIFLFANIQKAKTHPSSFVGHTSRAVGLNSSVCSEYFLDSRDNSTELNNGTEHLSLFIFSAWFVLGNVRLFLKGIVFFPVFFLPRPADLWL